MKKLIFILPLVFFLSCEKSKIPKDNFSKQELDSLILDLAPYVNKKPKSLSFEERFLPANRPYYIDRVKTQGSQFKYILPNDSIYYFLTVQSDLTSLYTHYKAIGGYLKLKDRRIDEVNFLFYSPRFTYEEVETKAVQMFDSMVEKGHVNQYLGNRNYVQWPNKDVYYNVAQKQWILSENSEWGKIHKMASGQE